MKWSFTVARVAGIDIKIHATFVIIIALGAFQWGDQHGVRGAVFGAVLMALLFICVILHELGHSIVAQYFGLPVREIVLLPIGGVARMEKNPTKPLHELLIAIAGPMVNVVIAGVLLVVTGATGAVGSLDARGLVAGQPMAPSLPLLLLWLLAANVSLAVFNMIPAFPMDGGRVLRAALAMAVGFSRGTRIASTVGQVLAVGLGLFAILTGHLLLTFIAIFVFLGAGQERAEEQARTVLTTLQVGDAYNKYALTLSPGDHVSKVVDYLLTSYQPDFAVLQGSALLGVVSREDVLRALATETADVYVAGIMDREVLSVPPETPLDDLRRAMQEKGVRIAAVHSEDRYLGLVSAEDIAEAILVSAFAKNQTMRREAMDQRGA
ncbi:MAG: site-2 protease family protein [Acidobacteriota bacterium]